MLTLLDTNFLSELRKPRPEPRVLAFFAASPIEDYFISIISIAEIRFGIETLFDQPRRQLFERWLSDDIRPFFVGRTLELSEPVLLRWRILLDDGRRAGRTFAQPDLFLAATALEHNLTLVTRNTKDFTSIPDLKLLNPWKPQP